MYIDIFSSSDGCRRGLEAIDIAQSNRSYHVPKAATRIQSRMKKTRIARVHHVGHKEEVKNKNHGLNEEKEPLASLPINAVPSFLMLV